MEKQPSALAKALREYVDATEQSRQYSFTHPDNDVIAKWKRVMELLLEEEGKR